MRAQEFINEANIGTHTKRPARVSARPARGHTNEPTYKLKPVSDNTDDIDIDESGKASRALCTGGRPDSDLGASNLASCKSQGLRARDGKKSHKIGKTRVTVGGKKIRGKKYGGPLPSYD